MKALEARIHGRQDKYCQTVLAKPATRKMFRVGSREFLASRVRHAFASTRAASRCALVLVGALLGATVVAFPNALRLRLNLSTSEPSGLYRVIPSVAVHRGSLVGLCLDRDLVKSSNARRYIGRGSCPNGLEPVLKEVVAEEGDVVETNESSVIVNGVALETSSTSPVDSLGRTLGHFRWGTHQLSPGELWLFSNRARSWDSRYFGPRRVEEVVAVVEPLFTFD